MTVNQHPKTNEYVELFRTGGLCRDMGLTLRGIVNLRSPEALIYLDSLKGESIPGTNAMVDGHAPIYAMIKNGAIIGGSNRVMEIRLDVFWDIYFNCEAILEYYDRISITVPKPNTYIKNADYLNALVDEMNHLLVTTHTNKVMMLDIAVIDLLDTDKRQMESMIDTNNLQLFFR